MRPLVVTVVAWFLAGACAGESVEPASTAAGQGAAAEPGVGVQRQALAAGGQPCSEGSQCNSGFCVDGVCCNAACGGGAAGDCQACSVAAGATVDGQCGRIAAGVVCRPQIGDCDLAETCNGTALACPTDRVRPRSFVCRGAAGGCDLADSCDGTTKICPADRLRPPTFTCRPKNGVCDVADRCTGDSAACPPDGFAPPSTQCRARNGACDVAESCTGSGPACPADGFAGPEVVCRAASGACDVADNCSGSSRTCPASAVLPAGTVCRPATHPCDAIEACNGTGVNCPADRLAAGGSPCSDGNACSTGDVCRAGVCTASGSVACPSASACREAGVCDPATGACSHTPRPDGTACDDGDACHGQDRCIAGTCATCAPADPGNVCERPGACIPQGPPGQFRCQRNAAPPGTTCSLPSATAVCQGTTCTIQSCDSQHLSCDDNGQNGCERARRAQLATSADVAAVAAADLDQDGQVDAITLDRATATVSVRRGDGRGGWSATASAPVPADPTAMATGDVDGDGDLDLVVSGGGVMAVLPGDGAGTFGAPRTVLDAFVTRLVAVALGDFNGDGHLDVAVSHDGVECPHCPPNALAWLAGDGTGNFISAGLTFLEPGVGYDLRTADFDGDGADDIAGALEQEGLPDGGAFLFRTATGLYHSFVAPGSGWTSVAIGDFDGDGEPDLAMSEADRNRVTLIRWDGSGLSLDRNIDLAPGISPLALVAGDFDGDGRTDLVASGASDSQLLSGDGAGGFTPGAVLAGVGARRATGSRTVATDLERDAIGDLLTADNQGSASHQLGCRVVTDLTGMLLEEVPTSAPAMLALLPDGTVHAQIGASGGAIEIDAQGAASSVPGVGSRPAIDARAGFTPLVVGGYENRRAQRQGGSSAWEWVQLGCCMTPLNPFTVDVDRGVLYQINNGIWKLDAQTGALLGSTGGRLFGELSMSGPLAWSALQFADAGGVERWDLATLTPLGTTVVSPGAAVRGAIAADDAFIGTSASGRVVRIRPDGTVDWSRPVGARSFPVITADGLVIFGVRGALSAYRPGARLPVWTVPVAGEVVDLAVLGGQGLYALTTAPAGGQMVALLSPNGRVFQIYKDLPPGVSEFLFRGDRIFVSTPQSINAYISFGDRYDPAAPWPARFHDPHRTGNRTTPLAP